MLIDMISFSSPTVPCQRPTSSFEYSASGMAGHDFAQATKQAANATTAIVFAHTAQLLLRRHSDRWEIRRSRWNLATRSHRLTRARIFFGILGSSGFEFNDFRSADAPDPRRDCRWPRPPYRPHHQRGSHDNPSQIMHDRSAWRREDPWSRDQAK